MPGSSAASRPSTAGECRPPADPRPRRDPAGEPSTSRSSAGLRSGQPLGPADGRARVGWLKLFADGTLGSRTAALLEPYAGRARPRRAAGRRRRDLRHASPSDWPSLAGRAAAAGIATQIHAIGDARGPRGPRRPRADGRPDGAPAAGRARPARRPGGPAALRGARASRPPSSRSDLRDDAAKARGPGAPAPRRGYPWAPPRSHAGAVARVRDGRPGRADTTRGPALAMAVRRRDPRGRRTSPPFGPAEALTLDQALRAACVGAATAAGEADRGRLAPGHRADLLVIPAAALAEPDALRTARPQAGGHGRQVVHEA